MSRKTLEKLEHDLGHYIISEITKTDPSKKSSPEIYKYRGLSITPNLGSKGEDKMVGVRIGALEAMFKINSGEKCAGFLNPDDERLIRIWMSQSDTLTLLKTLCVAQTTKKSVAIIPFDLEEFFSK